MMFFAKVDTAMLLGPNQIPAAPVPKTSDLICYCSIAPIATVACIWYVDFLPPHTVRGPLPVQWFFVRFQPVTHGDLTTFGCFGW